MVFRNSSTETAHKQILRWLDTDGDGLVSDEEKQRARIILLGHSWGGSAVIFSLRPYSMRTASQFFNNSVGQRQ